MSANRLNGIAFRVRACSDIKIALAAKPQIPLFDTYEIIIGWGANTLSAIREETPGLRLHQADTPDILSCSEYRAFWVDWTGGLISVGSGGDIGWGTFLSWRDPNPHPVVSLGFSAADSSEANWQFTEVGGASL